MTRERCYNFEVYCLSLAGEREHRLGFKGRGAAGDRSDGGGARGLMLACMLRGKEVPRLTEGISLTLNQVKKIRVSLFLLLSQGETHCRQTHLESE